MNENIGALPYKKKLKFIHKDMIRKSHDAKARSHHAFKSIWFSIYLPRGLNKCYVNHTFLKGLIWKIMKEKNIFVHQYNNVY